jgi:hypothetical protein
MCNGLGTVTIVKRGQGVQGLVPKAFPFRQGMETASGEGVLVLHPGGQEKALGVLVDADGVWVVDTGAALVPMDDGDVILHSPAICLLGHGHAKR